jgi:hypothetical protein
MALCRKCGREVGVGARWCPDCGSALGRTVRCHSCGNQFPSSLGKCPRCGAVGAAAYGRKYTLALVVGILVLILVFVGLCLFGWYQYTRTAEDQQRWFEEQKQR